MQQHFHPKLPLNNTSKRENKWDLTNFGGHHGILILGNFWLDRHPIPTKSGVPKLAISTIQADQYQFISWSNHHYFNAYPTQKLGILTLFSPHVSLLRLTTSLVQLFPLASYCECIDFLMHPYDYLFFELSDKVFGYIEINLLVTPVQIKSTWNEARDRTEWIKRTNEENESIKRMKQSREWSNQENNESREGLHYKKKLAGVSKFIFKSKRPNEPREWIKRTKRMW